MIDPEKFCPLCFAGTESSEHHEKCVAGDDIETTVCRDHPEAESWGSSGGDGMCNVCGGIPNLRIVVTGEDQATGKRVADSHISELTETEQEDLAWSIATAISAARGHR